MIQNFYDSGHNYNEVIRRGARWDDISHCNPWQLEHQ